MNTNLKCTESPQYTELNVVAESAHWYLGMKKKKTKEDENPVFKSGLFHPTFSDESHVLHQNTMLSCTL